MVLFTSDIILGASNNFRNAEFKFTRAIVEQLTHSDNLGKHDFPQLAQSA